jgi:DNA (cytosine-5)-methyltransferase 1
VLKWVALVKPRVIMLENVEEFQTWGSLNRRRHSIKSKKGQTYWKWRKQLQALGYVIETRELVAADYGAPTKRKRFFMVASCDGKPIGYSSKQR